MRRGRLPTSARWKVSEFVEDYHKIGPSCRGDVGIAPYAMGVCASCKSIACSICAPRKNAKLLLRRGGGEGDAHVGSLAVDGVDFDLALVLRENLAGDGKAPGLLPPDSRAACALSDAVEPLKKARQILLRECRCRYPSRGRRRIFRWSPRKFRFCRHRGYI